MYWDKFIDRQLVLCDGEIWVKEFLYSLCYSQARTFETFLGEGAKYFGTDFQGSVSHPPAL